MRPPHRITDVPETRNDAPMRLASVRYDATAAVAPSANSAASVPEPLKPHPAQAHRHEADASGSHCKLGIPRHARFQRAYGIATYSGSRGNYRQMRRSAPT